MTMRLFHATILTIGIACAAAAEEAAQGPDAEMDFGADSGAGPAPPDRRASAGPTMTGKATTGKERLGEKWTDEQRVNNCGVPPEKRGGMPRPEDCASGGRD